MITKTFVPISQDTQNTKDIIEDLMQKEKIEKVFREVEYPYETGKIIPESFWEEFKNKLDVHLSKEEIQKIFLNSYVLNFPMLELAKELKKKYKLVLLTNNYEDMFGFIKTE